MVKILSQAGKSLADMYDLEGSIVGIDDLDTRNLPIVHDVSGTVFSERLRFSPFTAITGALPQNTNFDLAFGPIAGDSVARLTGVSVFCNIAAQVATCSVSIHRHAFGSVVQRDIPVWIWGGDSFATRVSLDGAPVQRDALLGAPGQVQLPQFVGGEKQGPNPTTDIWMRGRMAGFGAGTETVWFVLFIAFSQTDGISNYGARIPSW